MGKERTVVTSNLEISQQQPAGAYHWKEQKEGTSEQEFDIMTTPNKQGQGDGKWFEKSFLEISREQEERQ